MKRILLFLLILGAGTLWAQEPVAYLEYFDDDYEIEVFDSEGNLVWVDFGLELEEGYTIKTYASTAELRMEPNGSIIKLAEDTEFFIDTFQRSEAEENKFELVTGKVRAIAAKAAGTEKYSIKTPTAVCGVRGTDFGLEYVEGELDAAAVMSGEVVFVKNTGESVSLTANMFANAYAASFEAITLPPEQMASYFKEMGFERLDPGTVPGHEAEFPKADDNGEGDNEAVDTAANEGSQNKKKEEKKAAGSDSIPNPLMDWLGDTFGMELGTITINEQTYSKLVLQPQFEIGKFGLGLYLPIIYSSNVFDMGDWYMPEGENEWNFGNFTNMDDLVHDLWLKVKYARYGTPNSGDDFYFMIGNLSDMAIGHGSIMAGYANDYDFPTVRKVGLNAGAEMGRITLEGVADDLSDINIVGGRAALRVLGPIKVGVTAIMDQSPAANLADETLSDDGVTYYDSKYGDPSFLAVGADMELFDIKPNDSFRMLVFSDVAGMLPILRYDYYDNMTNAEVQAILDAGGDPGDPTVQSGLRLEALYDNGEWKNYGIVGGLRGNILMLDYGLEYRYYKGIYRPSFFDALYEREKEDILQNTIEYLSNTDASEYNDASQGIYGYAGMSLMQKIHFSAGYMWPWESNGSSSNADLIEDSIALKLELEKGLIPGFDIAGYFSYERKYFLDTITGDADNFKLFDGYTLVSGELVYPIAPTLDLAVTASTATKYDGNGDAITDSTTGMPEVTPVYMVETRIHF